MSLWAVVIVEGEVLFVVESKVAVAVVEVIEQAQRSRRMVFVFSIYTCYHSSLLYNSSHSSSGVRLVV